MSHGGITKEQAELLAESEDRTTLPPKPPASRYVNHTYAGFLGGFYVLHRRVPTEQEIFDAGVRSGMERECLMIAAALA